MDADNVCLLFMPYKTPFCHDYLDKCLYMFWIIRHFLHLECRSTEPHRCFWLSVAVEMSIVGTAPHA